MIARPKIRLSLQSAAWQSAVRRHLEHWNLDWALDTHSLLREVALGEPHSINCLVVVELNAQTFLRTWKKLAETIQFSDATFVAVGNGPAVWKQLIRACGFVDCIESVSQMQRLNGLVERFSKSIQSSQFTIEEMVQQGLPWNPIRL